MRADLTQIATSLPAGEAGGAFGRTGALGPAGARELAQEFESLLILQMVKQMRQTFLDKDEQGEGFGAETMTETLDAELARVLAKQGGFGLGSFFERAIERGLGATGATNSAAEVAAPGSLVPVGVSAPAGSGAVRAVGSAAPIDVRFATRPALGPPVSEPYEHVRAPQVVSPVASAAEDPLVMPLDAPVSSEYGWRCDPFHGMRRFHGGVDFRAAYGRSVPAAASGVVVDAGERGGYGLTVVVEHSGGVRTRYAHLSSIGVEVGQEVAAQQVVGRVGQTGRATGPHLHFEVEVDGRRVDPSLVARSTGLKSLVQVADSSGERVPAAESAIGAHHED